jgi:hypothetical protein
MKLELPFSHEAFLDVFGAYNAALWPVAAVLWLASAWLAWNWIWRGRLDRRVLFALLAIHWTWSGIVYHWLFFRAINPAAALFGTAFVVQAVLFTWLAASSRGHLVASPSVRGILGGVLVLYGLVYPFLGFAFGLQYPRMPLFAVPCPTTLVTAGWLLTSAGVPRFVNIVPLLWAVIGSSAAFALGIQADLALVAAGALLAIDALVPSALGAKAAA